MWEGRVTSMVNLVHFILKYSRDKDAVSKKSSIAPQSQAKTWLTLVFIFTVREYGFTEAFIALEANILLVAVFGVIFPYTSPPRPVK